MIRRFCLAAALAVVLGAGPGRAQYDLPGVRPAAPTRPVLPTRPQSPAPQATPAAAPIADPKPVYNYELKPEHGEYMVFVKAYQAPVAGDERGQARELAEGLAEWIRSELRLYAFVYERGWTLRQEREKEKAAVIKAIREYYEPKGFSDEAIGRIIKRDVKLSRIADEYAVFVAPGKGTLNTFEAATEFAKYVHKLPAPPERFCDAVFVGAEAELARRTGDRSNPFEKALPGRNQTLPKKIPANERSRADEFLMRLNAGQPYSLIHKTKKDITLVVQTYGARNGIGRYVKPGETVQTSGPSNGEMLERAAQEANSLAEVLRSQKPPFDAYVLHTRFESFVCVGEFDSKDDPALLALQKALAGWQLKVGKTGSGQVVETLMESPLPAMIPRP